jgi:hypothetical protein
MDKSTPKKITPLSGYVFAQDKDWIYRLPKNEEEELEIIQALIDSFIDNPRYQLFGVTKEILALEYMHCRLWDRKNLNLTACYDAKTGALASVVRYANGDRSEIEPMPEAYAKNPGMLRVKAMTTKLDKRVREKYPELYLPPNKISRTAAGTIVKQYRGSKLVI